MSTIKLSAKFKTAASHTAREAKAAVRRADFNLMFADLRHGASAELRKDFDLLKASGQKGAEQAKRLAPYMAAKATRGFTPAGAHA